MSLYFRICSVLVLLFFIDLGNIFAQTPLYVRRYFRPSTTEKKEIILSIYPLVSNTLDLRNYRQAHPEFKNFIPEEVNITLPDLKGFQDIAWSVSYFDLPGEREGILLITLIGNYYSEQPVHFFDFNLDKDYTNDRNSPYIFPENVKIQPFVFTKAGLSYREFTLEIINPKYQERITLPNSANPQDSNPELPDYDFIETQQIPGGIYTAKTRLYWDMKGKFAYGGISYFFEAPDTRRFTAYFVEFNTKAIGTGVSLYHKKIRLRCAGLLENVFYWGSFGMKQVQGTPVNCTTSWLGKLECSNLNGYMREFSREILPKNRFMLQFSAGYAIPLFRRADFVPFLGVATLHYFNDIFIPNKAYRNVNYRFGFFPAYTAGCNLEYDLNGKGIFFVSGSFQNMEFNPKGFFEDVQNLDKVHNQINISLGYRVALSSKKFSN
ncbi:MAG: hypothetical protein R3C61_25215 [Bacteroidia bacterium]